VRESASRTHGGLRPAELAELGVDPTAVLDFSANLSPLPPPAAVREAMARCDPAPYPDPDCLQLTRALSSRLDVPPEWILIGNGSTQLIHLVTRVFVRSGQRPVALAPTFGEYAVATELAGGRLHPWPAQPQRGFRWNLRNKPDVLRRVAPPLLFLCNPNNPTGVYLGRDDVRALAAALTGGPLLLDEAYVDFLDAPWSSLDLAQSGRVIVLRSLTKQYGLAGLRAGYLVARPEVVQAVRRLQPAWSVSSVAEAAALAALADEGYLARMRQVVTAGKAELVAGLRALGLAVHEGAANFVLVDVGDAAAFRLRLLRHGLAVRDCTSFGLPSYVRIAARGADECGRLVEAIQQVLDERGSASRTDRVEQGVAP